jgi:hypothetical protein
MRYFTLETLLALTLSLAGVAPADTVESLAEPAPQFGPYAEPGGGQFGPYAEPDGG